MWNLAWYSFKNFLRCPKIHIFLCGWDFYRVEMKGWQCLLARLLFPGLCTCAGSTWSQNCQSSETKCGAMKSISSNILHLSTHHRASSQRAPWVLESTNFPPQVIGAGTAIELCRQEPNLPKEVLVGSSYRGSKWTSQEEASQSDSLLLND